MRNAEGKPGLLMLTPDYPPDHGGIQHLSREIALGLRGFAPSVVCPGAPGARRFDNDHPLPVLRCGSAHGPAQLAKLALNLAAPVAALRARPAILLSMHVVTAPAAAAAARLLAIPWVQYFHAKEVTRRRALARFAGRHSDLAIAVSSYTAGLLGECGVPQRRISIVHPGVSLPECADLPSPGGPAEPAQPIILTIARLQERYKGHDVMLAALPEVLRAVPGAKWVVIGDGPLRAELEARTRQCGLQAAVCFAGSACDSERDAWLRRSQLLAMPSRLPDDGGAGEGFGIVYLEAGAHGKPVVAGNVAGALDAVQDGRTGLLVDPTSPRAVASAIVRLLNDSRLREALGEAGRRRAKQLTWPLVVGRLESLLLATLNGAQPAPVPALR